MKRSKQKNIVIIFIISLILLGITFGIIYYNIQSDLNKSLIFEKMSSLPNVIKNEHQNMIITHIIIITVLIFLAYSIIGIPLIIFYLFYECTSLGFLIASFYAAFKIKGIIFSLIYILISKMPYLICLIYVCYIALKIAKKMLKVLIFKEQESLYSLLKNLFLKLIIVIIFIVIYDLFLYFLANKILKFFLFLIN